MVFNFAETWSFYLKCFESLQLNPKRNPNLGAMIAVRSDG